MVHGRLQKLFGVGPTGAVISVILLAIAIRIDRALGHPEMFGLRPLTLVIGVLMICIGLALLFWTMHTLRNWWTKDQLCTGGPFRWLRHPMYAAWITLVSSGIAFYHNSWVLLAWAVALHPIWHYLVIREEKIMLECFGDEYRKYAARTGRFVPRLRIF